MTDIDWTTKRLPVASLLLDTNNPRLTPATANRTQQEIIHYLFQHEKTLSVAESIARNGYFPIEPLLAIQDGRQYVVLEGNRRLAALKVLLNPHLLEGALKKRVDRVLREKGPASPPRAVPVTVAPSRAATDRLIAVRHIGTPILRWSPENRANFIVAKLNEGYSESELENLPGFSDAEVRNAHETQVIAAIIRNLDLPEGLKAKADSPDSAAVTTVKRVFDMSAGRAMLLIEPHPEQVFEVNTTKASLRRALTRLVTDVLSGNQNSRSLNSNEDIRAYFESWPPTERPVKATTTFAIREILGTGGVRPPQTKKEPPRKRTRRANPYVLPKDLEVKHGDDRLEIIRAELAALDRDKFPNAGVVLLRVFFELMIRDYMTRTKELETVKSELEAKNKLPQHGEPEMRHLLPRVKRIAKDNLEKSQAESLNRALGDGWLQDLNAFVHQVQEIPTPLEILQFWKRAEPLFRLMLEEPVPDPTAR